MTTLQPAPYSKDYEITDAMFGAFRSPGGARFFWVLFGWFTVLLSVLGFLTYESLLTDYVDLMRNLLLVEQDPSRRPEILRDFIGFVLFLTFYVICYTVILGTVRAAFFRGYFFGHVDGNFLLRAGWDEVRQTLVITGFFAVIMVLIILSTILVFVPFVAALIIGWFAEDGLGLILLIVTYYIVTFGIMIWGGIRLYPAGALTAFRQRAHLFAARHVSKNRFWALFGSLLVVGLIGYVVVNTAMMTALLMAFSGLNAEDVLTILAATDTEATLAAMERASDMASFNLRSGFAIVCVSAAYAFNMLLLAGPQAFFVKQWAEAGGLIDAE